MTKICPHCQRDFECRNDNVMECDCVNVIMSKESLHYINNLYSDCLSVDCLHEINLMPAFTRQLEIAQQYDMEKP
ncbi:MAG: cysteine-rich CWC family protein [Bacteroidales bacterium]